MPSFPTFRKSRWKMRNDDEGSDGLWGINFGCIAVGPKLGWSHFSSAPNALCHYSDFLAIFHTHPMQHFVPLFWIVGHFSSAPNAAFCGTILIFWSGNSPSNVICSSRWLVDWRSSSNPVINGFSLLWISHTTQQKQNCCLFCGYKSSYLWKNDPSKWFPLLRPLWAMRGG